MNKAEKATASSPSVVNKPGKAASYDQKPNGKAKTHSGKLRQLKAEQQLFLRTIQSRIFRYQAEAGEHTRLARVALDQAQAANLEYSKALQNYAKRLGIDLNFVAWDNDKLEFVEKPSEQAGAQEQAP